MTTRSDRTSSKQIVVNRVYKPVMDTSTVPDSQMQLHASSSSIKPVEHLSRTTSAVSSRSAARSTMSSRLFAPTAASRARVMATLGKPNQPAQEQRARLDHDISKFRLSSQSADPNQLAPAPRSIVTKSSAQRAAQPSYAASTKSSMSRSSSKSQYTSAPSSKPTKVRQSEHERARSSRSSSITRPSSVIQSPKHIDHASITRPRHSSKPNAGFTEKTEQTQRDDVKFQKIGDYETKLASLIAELEQLRSAIGEKDKAIESLQAEIVDLQLKVDDYKTGRKSPNGGIGVADMVRKLDLSVCTGLILLSSFRSCELTLNSRTPPSESKRKQ